ncbi:MAG: NAD(P)/FAD-dependent oxidoreductase [Gammaproteobacteria bacterium]|nr:NAD(P)/FAD-dependent oxidoreductase [Gammaproteobacteria bacterium]
MTERVECVVIGAGIVGLAVAQALAQSGREVLVLERNAAPGEETSSRNSEVIHAGIYYPTGSLKAQLCVRGKQLLYAHCKEFAVDYRRCGKLIVATSEQQLAMLGDYQRQAALNGAGELPWLNAAQVADLEPQLRCLAAVLSPSTGIIDSHGYMLSLQMLLERHGGMLARDTAVSELQSASDGIVVRTPAMDLQARLVVNSAGLHAPQLARTIDPAAPAAFFARGHYYALSGAAPFQRLVYPVAEQGGLGVHVTLDLSGQAKFGPDVQWIDTPDYTFDSNNRKAFVTAIRRYYPALEESRLHPSYTGIRPKLSSRGEAPADFRIDGPRSHGIGGLINLLGIESPGLTASLAIAEQVVHLADTANG